MHKRHVKFTLRLLALLAGAGIVVGGEGGKVTGEVDDERLPLPSYHFGAGIGVECMERDA